MFFLSNTRDDLKFESTKNKKDRQQQMRMLIGITCNKKQMALKTEYGSRVLVAS